MYIGIKLFENKIEIGKRKLEDFEILAQVIKKNEIKNISVRVFFFVHQKTFKQNLINHRNKFSLDKKDQF